MARDRADVVIIGAGISGAAVAYHLMAAGVRDVVMVDAKGPGEATSGAGAGFVGPWAAGYVDFLTASDLELELYGIDFYRRLAEEGHDIELRTNGSLYLGLSTDGIARWVDPVIEHPLAPDGTRALTPREVEEITRGTISAAAIAGGAIHPGGIQISAGHATRALVRRVVSVGGEMHSNRPVTGFLFADGKVTGVRTSGGDIRSEAVVVAAGAWSNDLLTEVGHMLPMFRRVATRVISPPSGVSASMPTVMAGEIGLWVREHRGGLTWGGGPGYSNVLDLGSKVEKGGQPRHSELVESSERELLPDVRKLIPNHDTSVASWLQGMPCMTADGRFLAGRVPGVDGLYALTGDHESGVTHGPGLGRVMAEIILTGESVWLNAESYRLDRFPPDHFPSEQSVLDHFNRGRSTSPPVAAP